MRGFEVFRLYIVLLHRKMALLKSNSGDTELVELELELEERLLEAHWLLGDDSSAPVELSKQWEEMVVSKGWLVGGQHNHGDEDGRQDNHGREDGRQGSKGESVENGGQGKIGWERARLA